MQRSEAMKSLKVSIKQQLDLNKSRNLFFENSAQIMEVEPGFLAALEELLNFRGITSSEDVFSEFISFTAKEFVNRLYSINPYLQITKKHIENLEQIYRQTWQLMVNTKILKTTLVDFHYPELSKWISTLYPVEFQDLLKFSCEVGHVTYGEYSAELQEELLGIDIARIKPPVMDIGCGSQANLVRHLRSLGVEAYGIDRQVEIPEPNIHQADWFDYPFEPGKWGTLVSNMGFTNHLNYAYLHNISQLESYLLKMKEIVESLSPGGTFYYAPSLPFIEDKLSTQYYKITREKKISEVFVSSVMRIG